MTEDLVDERRIATELSQRAINRLLSTSEKKLKEYWARYKNRDIATYAEYLTRKAIQVNAVRNFIYDRASADLNDIYIQTRLKFGAQELNDGKFLELLCAANTKPKKRPSRALVVAGHAGTGKSLFLKHAFFKIQTLDSKRIPVLLEARTFNRQQIADIETRIYDDLCSTGCEFIREQISVGLASGLFELLPVWLTPS